MSDGWEMIAQFRVALAACPIVAILRGVRPAEVSDIAQALFDEGIRVIEVPLNSPEPLSSIERLATAFEGRAIIGAGTVLTVEDVTAVAAAGGRLIVSPNMDVAVIRQTKKKGLVSAPGFLTPTEAFAAIAAGADILKFFPGELATPGLLKALSAVLPKSVPVLLVGGMDASAIGGWTREPVAGFGVGGALYRPGDTSAIVAGKARMLMTALRTA
jgi:2-dehydro-3-deoxyphosphogalactonate aldolase